MGEIYPDETSEFWKSPGITADEMKNIKTTVYRLACAGFAEKDGTMINSARWLQWKNAAVPPPGQARLDQDILAQIFLKVRELYQKEGGKFPDPILNLTWDYTIRKSVACGSCQGDQRQSAGRHYRPEDAGSHQGWPAVAGIRVVEGRRHDLLWQLALFRMLDRSGNPAPPWDRRSIGPGHLSELGMVLAGESTGFVQPCLVRPAGKPWDPDAQAGLVE